MKRIIACFLLSMALLSFFACEDVLDAEMTDPFAAVIETGGDSAQTKTPEQARQAATIEETVLIDQAGVKITAKSLHEDTLFGSTLNLLIENNSGKDLTFQCRNASINGYMVETMMSVDVVNGKKAMGGKRSVDTLTFLAEDLEENGIGEITELELAFCIADAESWDTITETEIVTITP